MVKFDCYEENNVCKRVEFTLEVENLELDQMGPYIEKVLLPLLEKNYQGTKEFFKNKTRSHVYNIKKELIDLLEGEEALKIPRPKEDDESEVPTKYSLLLAMLDCINLVYFFAIIIRNKLRANSPMDERIRKVIKIIKEAKSIQEDLFTLVEMGR